MNAKKRSRNWISKSDLVRWVRCPYAAWLLYKGLITFEDTVDEFQLRLMTEGVAFQEAVEAKAFKIEAAPKDLRALLTQDIALFRPPVFENRELKIFGQPDGIDAAGGALIPIEIKSHKDVQRIDELELAFYWLLLEPYRSSQLRRPRGVLILRRDGRDERVEVDIPAHRFSDVNAMLAEIRLARLTNRVRERVCRCNVCSQIKHDDVMRAVLDGKDLTLIYGIDRPYARALERLGIGTWEQLIGCDPESMVAGMRSQKYYVGVKQVEQWSRHAEAWKTRRSVIFAAEPFLPKQSYIALDLEYLNLGLIWLIGTCVVTPNGREHHGWWADDPRGERRSLRKLGELVAAHPDLPIVTWSGESADIPNLFRAGARTGLSRNLAPVFERHVDAFRYAERGVRLPIPSLGLKFVAEHFGMPRVSRIRSGRQAEQMYMWYRSPGTEASRKAKIKAQLVDYNREDIETLIGVVGQIRELTNITANGRRRKMTRARSRVRVSGKSS